jgi:hypothetical protein
MQKPICLIVLALVGASLFPVRSASCTSCASTSTSSVKGNCVVREWSVCCDGPGAGEVSCFNYTEIVYCAPIID